MNPHLKVKFKKDFLHEVKVHLRGLKKWIYVLFFLNVFLLALHGIDLLGIDIKHFFESEKKKEVAQVATEKQKEEEPAVNSEPFYYMGHSYREPDSSGVWSTSVLDSLKIDSLSIRTKNGIEGLFGIDVSNWQNTINWSSVYETTKAQSVDFAIIKATQGATIVDAYFNRNWKDTVNKDKIKGAYHFYSYKDDPKTQAELFIDHVKLKSGDFRPIIDIELACADCKTPGVDQDKMIRDLKYFIALIEQEYKVQPILYTYISFYHEYLAADFSNYEFWMAEYDQNPPVGFKQNADSLGAETPKVLMWQFTSHAHVNGVVGKVDMSFVPQKHLSNLLMR